MGGGRARNKRWSFGDAKGLPVGDSGAEPSLGEFHSQVKVDAEEGLVEGPDGCGIAKVDGSIGEHAGKQVIG